VSSNSKETSMQEKTGKKTLSGMLWMLFATGIGKFATLITQVVLGWLLTKEDFGLYALALSVSASVALLRNGGTQQLLIQKGTEYTELAPSIFKFSLLFNCMACLFLLFLSPIAATVYKAPELQGMLSIIAVSILLMTPFGILRAKLIIDHRFKETSIVGLISNITRQGSTIVCAFMGLGYMSFIWPILLEPIVLSIVSYYFVRGWVKSKRLTINEFKKIFVDAKWVMLGSLALALFATGEYFVIGLFEDKESLGIYFFGFQLVIVVSVIITSAIETVFLPVLAKLPEKQYKQAYINTLFLICSISLIISILGFINAEWLINFVWKGKWDQAIFIIEVLILTMPAILLTNFNKVVMESKGLWGKRLINLSIFVIGDIIVAGISSWKYDIYYTAIMVCCYRNVFAFVQCLWMKSVVKISLRKLLSSVVPNVFLMLFISASTFVSINYLHYLNNDGVLRNLVLSIVIVILFLMFNFVFERKKIKQYFKDNS